MSKEVKTINKSHLIAVLLIFIPALAVPGMVMAAEQGLPSAQDSSNKYFKIQVSTGVSTAFLVFYKS